MLLNKFIFAIFFAFSIQSSSAWWSDFKNKIGGAWDEVEKFGKDAVNEVEKFGKDAVNEVEKFGKGVENTYNNVVKDVEKFGKDAVNEVEKFGKDVENTYNNVVKDVEKFGKDAINEVEKFGKDVEKFGKDAVDEVEKFGKDAINEVEKFGKGVEKFGKDAIDEVEKFGKDAINEVEKFGKDAIDEVEKFGKNVVNEAEKFGKNVEITYNNIVSDISNFWEDTKREIIKFTDDSQNKISEVADTLVAEAKAIYKDSSSGLERIVETAKDSFKYLQNLEFIHTICNSETPQFVKDIAEWKNEICDKPTNLIDIKNRIYSALKNFRAKSLENVVTFADEFGGRIKAIVTELKKRSSEKFTQTKSAVLNMLSSIHSELDKFMEYLATPHENSDEILGFVAKFINQVEDFRNAAKNFVETDLKDAAEREEFLIIVELINEIKTIIDAAENVKTNLIDTIVKSLTTVFEWIENSVEKIKEYISNAPQKYITIDENEKDGIFKDLKELALAESDNIIDEIFKTAEETLMSILRQCEIEIDAKKNFVCSAINKKLRSVEKVGKFICNTFAGLDEEFTNFFDDVQTVENLLYYNFELTEEHIKNQLRTVVESKKSLYSTCRRSTLNEIAYLKHHADFTVDIGREFRVALHEFTKKLDKVENTAGTECAANILSGLPLLQEQLKEDLKMCTGISTQPQITEISEILAEVDESYRNFDQCIGEKGKKNILKPLPVQNQCVNSFVNIIKTMLEVDQRAVVEWKMEFIQCTKEKNSHVAQEFDNMMTEIQNCTD